MEFEDIKAAFQKKELEGYLFETPPAVVAMEVRRAAEKRQQKFERRRIADHGNRKTQPLDGHHRRPGFSFLRADWDRAVKITR